MDNIIVYAHSNQLEKTYYAIANRLTPDFLAAYGYYSENPSDLPGMVVSALTNTKYSWLRKYLQKKVDIAMEHLHLELTDKGSTMDPGEFLSLLGLSNRDDLPDGCYCGTCFKECIPEWYDSKDAWVPSCHTNSELHKHPNKSEPMEIDDILSFAAEADIDAYNATISDLRATERSVS